MLQENELLEFASFDDFNESYEPYFQNFLNQDKVKKRMISYLRTGGINPLKENCGKTLAFQVFLRRLGQENKAKEKFRQENKITPESYKKYDEEGMESFLNFEADQFDNEEGFEGFEEFDSELNDFEGFVPLAIAGALGKKIAPKLISKIKDSGKKLLGKIVPKLQKKQETDISQNQSLIEAKKADLLNKGADLSQIQKISSDLNKKIEEIKAQNKGNSVITSNAIIQNEQKGTLTILDKLNEVLETYKKGETEKEKNKALPWIIGISAFVIILIIVLNRVLK